MPFITNSDSNQPLISEALTLSGVPEADWYPYYYYFSYTVAENVESDYAKVTFESNVFEVGIVDLFIEVGTTYEELTDQTDQLDIPAIEIDLDQIDSNFEWEREL